MKVMFACHPTSLRGVKVLRVTKENSSLKNFIKADS